jgi:hypothetical protein
MTKATEAPEKAGTTLAAARPQISLLHHMAAVLAMQGSAEHGVTVKMVDGGLTKGKFDSAFTDGLSLVVGNHKEYFPLTAITKIVIHTPNVSRPEVTKRGSIASQLAR